MTVGGDTFGALAEAVASEISQVLSFNPLTIDLSKAMPVLVLVGAFVFVIFTGFAYFLRVDKFERHCFIYMREYEIEKERKKIEEDLRAGGSGIVVEAEATEMGKESEKESKEKEVKKEEVRGFTSRFNAVVRTLRDGVRGRGRYDKYRVHAGATEQHQQGEQRQEEQQDGASGGHETAPADQGDRAPPALRASPLHGLSHSPPLEGSLVSALTALASRAQSPPPPPHWTKLKSSTARRQSTPRTICTAV